MTTDGEERAFHVPQNSGRSDLAPIDRSSSSDPKAGEPHPRHQGMEKMPQSKPNQNGTLPNADDDDEEPQDEVVWLHGRLGYKVVNGTPFVLVPVIPRQGQRCPAHFIFRVNVSLLF
jgi:hypothetical protein